jgi:hypothetical protein
MRYSATHFEQVPIEIVETVLRHDATLGKTPEKSRASVPEPEREAAAEFLEQQEIAKAKGKR